VTHLSVRTLRRYHRDGLLEPTHVDPGNGYRWYSADQVADAQVIRRFRELDMPVAEAVEFFANQPAIARYMQTLLDVGLGYVRLGQSAPTLSGGEAQRVKLATELAKRSTGHTIYLLDEPTTGLHFDDVRRLLTVLSRLVDQGNTVLVIEHSLDVIKTADWVIDLGPEGGSGGGMVIAEGTPEDIARTEGSHTGRFLRPLLGME